MVRAGQVPIAIGREPRSVSLVRGFAPENSGLAGKILVSGKPGADVLVGLAVNIRLTAVDANTQSEFGTVQRVFIFRFADVAVENSCQSAFVRASVGGHRSQALPGAKSLPSQPYWTRKSSAVSTITETRITERTRLSGGGTERSCNKINPALTIQPGVQRYYRPHARCP